jgi:hypothetical protein
MRRHTLGILTLSAVLVAGAPGARSARGQDAPEGEPAPQAEAPDEHGWPRVFEEEGMRLQLYQPQLESWSDGALVARAAVCVEDGGADPAFGVVWFGARTEVDKEERIVTLEQIELTRADFPSAPDKGDRVLQVLRGHMPTSKTLALDRFEASLALVAARKAEPAGIRNDPPRIFFSSRPALLVLIDGAPVVQRVAGRPLHRILNTRSFLLESEDGSRFYLGVGDRLLSSASLSGPWTLSGDLPEGARALRQAAAAENGCDFHEDDTELTSLLAQGEAPTIYISTEPAELIESDGEPELVEITGTNLLWMKNTDGAVIVDSTTNERYVLISGRWFHGPSLDGPWTWIPGENLPHDFAHIPSDEVGGEVLVSIPGTRECQEALIENDVPQTAWVDRAQATLEVTYDGDCELRPIEGTNVSYCVNTDTPVVFCGGSYYACQKGVWFLGVAPRGPWRVCDAVTPAIYTIPPSCPIHYCTYVRIYRSTSEAVYCGYTPGYLGTCVEHGTVVWGTGVRHEPWVRDRWIGAPATYGFSVGVRATPTGGLNVGLAVGARAPSRPWWGPLRQPHAAFQPVRSEDRSFHLNAANANVYTTWPKTALRPHAVPAPRPEPAKPVHPAPNTPAARPANNVYAAPNGQVYRKTDAGWEQHQAGKWQPAPSPASRPDQRVQQLEAEKRAREVGTQRAQNVRAPAPAAPLPAAPSRPMPPPSRVDPTRPTHSAPAPATHPAPAPATHPAPAPATHPAPAPPPSRPAPAPASHAPTPPGLRGNPVRTPVRTPTTKKEH